MRSLHSLSIRYKFMIAIMLTTIAALSVSTLAMFVYEKKTFRLSVENDLRTQAQLVADFAAPAMAFHDVPAARQIVEALQARPRIQQAILFNQDGSIFTKYSRQGNFSTPQMADSEGFVYTDRSIGIFYPVELGNDTIGKIYLEVDTSTQINQWRERLFLIVVTGASVLVLALLLAFQLQKLMTNSILSLADAARAVVAKQDYSFRAKKSNDDEIGELATAFNRMLDHIANREEQLLASEQKFRQLADTIYEVFWLTDETKHNMLFISRAYEEIWGRTCEELYANPVTWMEAIHPEDRERIRQAAFTEQTTGEYNEQYRIVRPDGSIRWIHDRAFPIRDAQGKVYRIAGIAEDITERRQMERQILEISEQERARIGHEIHDGLCQNLVGITFMVRFLRDKLMAHHPGESDEATEIGRLLQESINQARGISYNLYPAHLLDNGLCGSLQQLADQTSITSKIKCQFDCNMPVKSGNVGVLLNLYRIAQESVANALKHAHPRSIAIRLSAENGGVELVVEDDGIGIPDDKRRANGLGLRIMQYRASVIGGTVEIQRRPDGGTIVRCHCPSVG